MHRQRAIVARAVTLTVVFSGPLYDLPVRAEETSAPAGVRTFVERKVLPLLVARCYECHGPRVEEPKGELRIASRELLLKGGETGPAIVPGRPGESLLIKAINYENLEMPPRTRLPDGEVAILTRWVDLGAPWPGDLSPTSATPTQAAFPLDQRRAGHWSWKPIEQPEPPDVNNAQWPRRDLDRFVLNRIEREKLSPRVAADRHTLIRRAYYTLIGLPPTPEQVRGFVDSPGSTAEALSALVDELLDSVHFGEHWARHWLDLMRYAETLGHEYDYPLHHARQYRDYVIRAFNADVPYDQFVTEHIAGDLMENPRRNATEGYNESIIGTGFWFLGENVHAPVDVRQHEADRIDNQIDVFSKAFLGLTVACARCHDHKFDAITTRDYYALAGFLQSSRRDVGYLDPHGRIRESLARIDRIRKRLSDVTAQALRGSPDRQAAEIAKYLTAAHGIVHTDASLSGASRLQIEAAARDQRLDPDRLAAWVAETGAERTNSIAHPLWVWSRIVGDSGANDAASLARRYRQAQVELAAAAARADAAAARSAAFADFDGSDFAGWFSSGHAFGPGPTTAASAAAFRDAPATTQPGIAHSGLLSKRLCGILRSPTFEITHPRILYRVAGQNARIRLIIDGYGMDEFSSLLFRGR